MKKIIIEPEIKPVKKNVTFRLKPDIIKDIRKLAKENEISMVAVVEYAIKKLKEELEREG